MQAVCTHFSEVDILTLPDLDQTHGSYQSVVECILLSVEAQLDFTSESCSWVCFYYCVWVPVLVFHGFNVYYLFFVE